MSHFFFAVVHILLRLAYFMKTWNGSFTWDWTKIVAAIIMIIITIIIYYSHSTLCVPYYNYYHIQLVAQSCCFFFVVYPKNCIHFSWKWIYVLWTNSFSVIFLLPSHTLRSAALYLLLWIWMRCDYDGCASLPSSKSPDTIEQKHSSSAFSFAAASLDDSYYTNETKKKKTNTQATASSTVATTLFKMAIVLIFFYCRLLVGAFFLCTSSSWCSSILSSLKPTHCNWAWLNALI